MNQSENQSVDREPDPVCENGKREMFIILLVTAIVFVAITSISYYTPFRNETGELILTLGMPNWVFWGVLIPWIASTVFAVWFSLGYMAEDDLGESPEEQDHIAEEQANA